MNRFFSRQHAAARRLLPVAFLIATAAVAGGAILIVASRVQDRIAPSANPLESAASRPQVEVEAVRLTEMTASSGVHFAYQNDRGAGFYTILESLGGGA